MPILSRSAHDIDLAGTAIDTELPITWLEEQLSDTDVRATAPGHVSVRLSRTGEDIVVRGHVKASLAIPCARCLAPTPLPVSAELTLLLRPAPVVHHAPRHAADAASPNGRAPKAAAAKPGKEAAAKPAKDKDIEYEFTAEEADIDLFDGETVVLDSFVREALLLEVPNFPLCSEGCAGIAPAPAEPASTEAEPRIDPRLLPLNAIRARLQGTAERPSTTKAATNEGSSPPKTLPMLQTAQEERSATKKNKE